MRDYSKISPQFWIDCFGVSWNLIKSTRRLKFKYPLHAAIRKHVFHVDNYQCKRCKAKAVNIPKDWDGKQTLSTNNLVNGYKDCLVVDHIITLKAGGKNEVENMQTLCETCNRKKLKEDLLNIKNYKLANQYGAR